VGTFIGKFLRWRLSCDIVKTMVEIGAAHVGRVSFLGWRGGVLSIGVGENALTLRREVIRDQDPSPAAQDDTALDTGILLATIP
jgi:hypothetical protein